jgi:hypothetical protein
MSMSTSHDPVPSHGHRAPPGESRHRAASVWLLYLAALLPAIAGFPVLQWLLR